MTLWRVLEPHEEAALVEGWRSATPFRHLVVDDFVPAEALPELVAIVDDEPVDTYVAEIYAFDATAPEPETPAFSTLRDELARALIPALERISSKALRRADMRAYAYRAGHYLLPHNDHQEAVARALAYAYYLPTPEPPVGGELELFDCRLEGHEIVAVESARRIEPRPNRLVVFEVSDRSLHQVREVLSGLRASLAGWFYP
jgi:Rps23 Pro-64 3,4-dihydroxylase Tpa1-like proline 4-hydroxylase